ncbi:hypothetical protein L9F63_013959, partial [Diploptera punctata]
TKCSSLKYEGTFIVKNAVNYLNLCCIYGLDLDINYVISCMHNLSLKHQGRNYATSYFPKIEVSCMTSTLSLTFAVAFTAGVFTVYESGVTDIDLFFSETRKMLLNLTKEGSWPSGRLLFIVNFILLPFFKWCKLFFESNWYICNFTDSYFAEYRMEVTTEHTIPLEILDDLGSRFIINVPVEERKDLVRICFQIELAHWYYLDFYCADEKLKPCSMKEFATHMFQHIPFLKPHSKNLDSVLEQWREYKQAVPTYGAILLTEDLSQVLLVQSYWAKSSWGFPKGKINEEEEPIHCAVREVLEETGFDISKMIDKNEFIESTINDQMVRLYIVSGIPKDTKFQPKTRNEIKSIEWFTIVDLPNNKKDMTPKVKIGVGPNAFFMVVPFIKRLKRWIFDKQQKGAQTARRHRHKSVGDVEVNLPKNKRQQFAQAIQAEMQDFQLMRQQKLSNSSPPRNAYRQEYNNGKVCRIYKRSTKRQLFVEEDDDPNDIIGYLSMSKIHGNSVIIMLSLCSIQTDKLTFRDEGFT